MNYCIVNSETELIENIIICEDPSVFADLFDIRPSYPGAFIGDKYELPSEKPTEIEILRQQVDALSARNDFLEECIAEMASVVYA